MVFGTQSPRDALASPIAHTIVEQCPTQVFFPNGARTGRGLCRWVSPDPPRIPPDQGGALPESRRFLVKQGHNAVVAELDLGGLEDHLAVLSGRTATVELLDRIRAEVGDDPADWMPLFHQRRKELA